MATAFECNMQGIETKVEGTVTITRIGTNQKYASGWDAAFGSGKKKSTKASSSATASKSKPVASKKAAKKSAKAVAPKTATKKTPAAPKKAAVPTKKKGAKKGAK